MAFTNPSIYPPASHDIQKFASRRSVVHSTKGIVACTQPLAAKCGIDILNAGGNAADAAVAVGELAIYSSYFFFFAILDTKT